MIYRVTTGPISQSSMWGGFRYGVFSKFPQTGFYSESYSGGKTPEAIDATGFDAIIIHGVCTAPSILSITPKGAGIHRADDIWGMETYAAEDAVMDRFSKHSDYKKRGAVVIGLASENGVVFGLM